MTCVRRRQHAARLLSQRLISRPSLPAEADPAAGAGQPGGDRAFAQSLQVDGRCRTRKPRSRRRKSSTRARRLEPAARQRRSIRRAPDAAQQVGRPAFDDPSQKRSRQRVAQGIQHRQRVQHVANGAEPDDQNAWLESSGVRASARRWKARRGILAACEPACGPIAIRSVGLARRPRRCGRPVGRQQLAPAGPCRARPRSTPAARDGPCPHDPPGTGFGRQQLVLIQRAVSSGRPWASSARARISDCTKSGATIVTPTPLPASSIRSDSKKPITACLLAA